jgi:transposase
MKFIKPLSEIEKLTLQEAYMNHPQFRVRHRAHALLLNNRGYSIAQLQHVFEVNRDTVSAWLDRWENDGITGLFDGVRSGRPTIFTLEEQDKFRNYVDENPHQLKEAVTKLREEVGKDASLDTYKRFLKKLGYTWKRCRHSLKRLRNESDFRKELEDQFVMRKKEIGGEVEMYYFDGSGFSTTSCVPYGWQKVGETREIPCKRSKRLNVLGFINRENKSLFHTVEGSVTSAVVIEAFDAFATQYAHQYNETQVPCVVTLDNASIHHSKAVKQRMNDWAQQGVFLHFLPAYSPELNLIEILWRKIKYEWLPMSSYKNYQTMRDAVLETLHCFGGKYVITFT